MAFDDANNTNMSDASSASANNAPQQPATSSVPAQGTPAQPAQPAQAPQTVSNGPAQQAPAQAPAQQGGPSLDYANHPAVQRAGLLRSIAETLAGGPRVRTTINDDGTRSVQRVPLDKHSIGMAIALEALSGGLAGLAAGRGRGAGAAGVAGIQQGEKIAQQRIDADEQQAQQDFKNRNDALVRKANVSDLNARTILNTSEAEARGADTLQKVADQNKQLIDDYDSAGVLHGRSVSQQEMADGIQAGTFSPLDNIGPIDGYRLLGDGRVEATHAVILDPRAKVPLRQDQWNDFANAHVPGFPKGTRIGDQTEVSGLVVARANEIKNSNQLAQLRHDEVADALKGSDDPKVKALAAQVPALGPLLDDPKTGAGLATALTRFQKYVSHSDLHGMDLYQSLQQMAQPMKADGKGGAIPNPDAKYAPQIAQAFGGWGVLQAYHNEVTPLEIKSEAQAADMLASNQPNSRAYKYAQRWMNAQTQAKAAQAGAEEKARAAANPLSNDAAMSTPDALGFKPNVPGGLREYNKRFGTFKKNADALSQTEGTYQQFQAISKDIAAGNYSGADSIVGLFDAIGISATPLAGRGFRVNQHIVAEHTQARGWMESLRQRLMSVKDGEVITPKQLSDYAGIASQARHSQYIGLVNQAHNAGLNADFALPTGNGEKIDQSTAKIFVQLTGGDFAKAAAAMKAKGWAIQ